MLSLLWESVYCDALAVTQVYKLVFLDDTVEIIAPSWSIPPWKIHTTLCFKYVSSLFATQAIHKIS